MRPSAPTAVEPRNHVGADRERHERCRRPRRAAARRASSRSSSITRAHHAARGDLVVEEPRQVVHVGQVHVRPPEEARERLADEPDAAGAVGDQHAVGRRLQRAAQAREAVLGDEVAHRPDLQRDVAQRGADRARRARGRPAIHARAVPRTRSVQTANERRGERSRGSLPGITGLCGLPAQRTSRSCSPRSQNRYSRSGRDSSTASTPPAVGASGANSGSRAQARRSRSTPPSVRLRRRPSRRARAVRRCDGTSPTVMQLVVVDQDGAGRAHHAQQVALFVQQRALPLRRASTSPRSAALPCRRTSAVVRTCEKFSRTAMRVDSDLGDEVARRAHRVGQRASASSGGTR